jgi:hypothetical protein
VNTRSVLAFGAGALMGVGVTFLFTPAPSGQGVTTSTKAAPAPPRPPEASRRSASPSDSRLVCVDRRELPDGECAGERLASSICEAQLTACAQEKSALRHKWDENGPEAEDPDRFHEIAEEALESCQLGRALEVIDCTEYPCVAALRASDDGRPQEVIYERLAEQVRQCPALRSAFSVGQGDDDALQVHAVTVPCGGRPETAYVLAPMDTRGAAWRAWSARGEGDNVFEVLRWMFRRGDDVAAVWDCADG